MSVPDLRRLWDDVWPVLLILIPGLLGTRPDGEDELEWSRQPDLFAYGLVVFAAASAAAAAAAAGGDARLLRRGDRRLPAGRTTRSGRS